MQRSWIEMREIRRGFVYERERETEIEEEIT